VLHWINIPSAFIENVANHVVNIQENIFKKIFTSSNEWRHVMKDNPADAIFQGQLPLEFSRN